MISLFIFILYIAVRLGFDTFWNNYSIYYSYLFEFVFVVVTFLYYQKKKQIKIEFKIPQKIILKSTPWFFLGYIFHKLANVANVPIPFNFKSYELIFLLLILAPILEEFIFRMSLWESVDDFIKNDELKIWISTFLFSAGHLISLFYVPSEFKSFVLFQTMYVVILGIGASKIRIETKSVSGAILLHFLFNLGFLIAAFV
jgi:membrane protease YdiL (CAAX protease family)